MPCKKGQTRYSKSGKQEVPLTLQQFKENMASGKFVQVSHRAFAVGLYYFGLRKNELRKAIKNQFSIQGKYLVFDVGQRLKHSKQTDPLKVRINAPFVKELITQINQTPENDLVFLFSDRTAYNVMQRAGFYYPHYCRLSRITNLFSNGGTVPEVKSFTGLSLKALDFYLGKVSLAKIGDKLGEQD